MLVILLSLFPFIRPETKEIDYQQPFIHDFDFSTIKAEMNTRSAKQLDCRVKNRYLHDSSRIMGQDVTEVKDSVATELGLFVVFNDLKAKFYSKETMPKIISPLPLQNSSLDLYLIYVYSIRTVVAITTKEMWIYKEDTWYKQTVSPPTRFSHVESEGLQLVFSTYEDGFDTYTCNPTMTTTMMKKDTVQIDSLIKKSIQMTKWNVTQTKLLGDYIFILCATTGLYRVKRNDYSKFKSVERTKGHDFQVMDYEDHQVVIFVYDTEIGYYGWSISEFFFKKEGDDDPQLMIQYWDVEHPRNIIMQKDYYIYANSVKVWAVMTHVKQEALQLVGGTQATVFQLYTIQNQNLFNIKGLDGSIEQQFFTLYQNDLYIDEIELVNASVTCNPVMENIGNTYDLGIVTYDIGEEACKEDTDPNYLNGYSACQKTLDLSLTVTEKIGRIRQKEIGAGVIIIVLLIIAVILCVACRYYRKIKGELSEIQKKYNEKVNNEMVNKQKYQEMESNNEQITDQSQIQVDVQADPFEQQYKKEYKQEEQDL